MNFILNLLATGLDPTKESYLRVEEFLQKDRREAIERENLYGGSLETLIQNKFESSTDYAPDVYHEIINAYRLYLRNPKILETLIKTPLKEEKLRFYLSELCGFFVFCCSNDINSPINMMQKDDQFKIKLKKRCKSDLEGLETILLNNLIEKSIRDLTKSDYSEELISIYYQGFESINLKLANEAATSKLTSQIIDLCQCLDFCCSDKNSIFDIIKNEELKAKLKEKCKLYLEEFKNAIYNNLMEQLIKNKDADFLFLYYINHLENLKERTIKNPNLWIKIMRLCNFLETCISDQNSPINELTSVESIKNELKVRCKTCLEKLEPILFDNLIRSFIKSDLGENEKTKEDEFLSVYYGDPQILKEQARTDDAFNLKIKELCEFLKTCSSQKSIINEMPDLAKPIKERFKEKCQKDFDRLQNLFFEEQLPSHF